LGRFYAPGQLRAVASSASPAQQLNRRGVGPFSANWRHTPFSLINQASSAEPGGKQAASAGDARLNSTLGLRMRFVSRFVPWRLASRLATQALEPG